MKVTLLQKTLIAFLSASIAYMSLDCSNHEAIEDRPIGEIQRDSTVSAPLPPNISKEDMWNVATGKVSVEEMETKYEVQHEKFLLRENLDK